MKRNIALGLLLLMTVLLGACSSKGPNITIKNALSYDAKELYVSPASSSVWGSDLLIGETLSDGDTAICSSVKK